MPQQIACPKHKTKLEPDGICHQCVLEKSKETAKQMPQFAKMLRRKYPKKGKKRI
jgi:hypothetical protein